MYFCRKTKFKLCKSDFYKVFRNTFFKKYNTVSIELIIFQALDIF